MAVRIVPYSPELESEFVAAYNRSIEDVPDCYPVLSVDATAFRYAAWHKPTAVLRFTAPTGTAYRHDPTDSRVECR